MLHVHPALIGVIILVLVIALYLVFGEGHIEEL